jgi:hypothetical protein
MNVSGANYSFLPSLDTRSALPLTHNLGDITLRVRKAATPATPSSSSDSTPNDSTAAGAAGDAEGWAFFSSTWGPFSAVAKPVASEDPHTVIAHDITAVVATTKLSSNPPGHVAPFLSRSLHSRIAIRIHNIADVEALMEVHELMSPAYALANTQALKKPGVPIRVA